MVSALEFTGILSWLITVLEFIGPRSLLIAALGLLAYGSVSSMNN